MADSRRWSADRTWHYAVAGALLLAGPIARNLYYERYPAGRPEVAILVGGLALLGAGLAAGSFRLNRYLSDGVFALLLLIYLDLDFNPDHHLPLTIVAVGCLAVARIFRERRATIGCIVLGTFELASVPSRTNEDRVIRHPAAATGPASGKPIVHVVLDEHLGIGGFRAIGDSATASLITDFFARRRFDVYEGAYSRFFFTQNSVPAVLSLGGMREGDMITWGGRPPFRLRANPYFGRLHSQGYDLHVYESANLQLCETPNLPVATCVQVPPNSVANIGYMDVGVKDRALLVMEFYLRYASALVPRFHRWLPRLQKRRLFARRGVALLDQAGTDLLARRRQNDFVFIHLLLPHSPYEVDERCQPYPRNVRPMHNVVGSVSDSAAAILRARYAKQVRCTYRLMDRFLDRVDQAYGAGQAIVVVHGDHGVRGTPVPPNDGRLAAFRRGDLNAGFSTLLAVRTPGTSGQIHSEPVPLQDFLWGLVTADFTALPTGPWKHFVYSTATADPDRWTPRALTPTEMIWASANRP